MSRPQNHAAAGTSPPAAPGAALAPQTRTVRAAFPGTFHFREMAVRLVSGAAKMVAESEPAFCDEVSLVFEAALDAILQSRGQASGRDQASDSSLLEVVIEVARDWIEIRTTHHGPRIDVAQLAPALGLAHCDSVSYTPGAVGASSTLALTKWTRRRD
jgi:hypothetical protein